MDVAELSQSIGKRFRLKPPPVLAVDSVSKTPIVFSRLSGSKPFSDRSADVPPENAFTMQVLLQPLGPTDTWSNGKHRLTMRAPAGATYLFDLRDNPISHVREPFDFVRFYMSQESLDDLAYEKGLPRIDTLRQARFGNFDRTMHGLATTLTGVFENPTQASSFFVDHLALAFHAHLLNAYGRAAPSLGHDHAGLSPTHLRRASDAIMAELDGNPTIEKIASTCGLSASHFARAFKQSTGFPPHQWLTRKRVERAREMLRHDSVALAEIAIACGFTDQSHLTRVFSRHEGHSPGKWRRIQR